MSMDQEAVVEGRVSEGLKIVTSCSWGTLPIHLFRHFCYNPQGTASQKDRHHYHANSPAHCMQYDRTKSRVISTLVMYSAWQSNKCIINVPQQEYHVQQWQCLCPVPLQHTEQQQPSAKSHSVSVPGNCTDRQTDMLQTYHILHSDRQTAK